MERIYFDNASNETPNKGVLKLLNIFYTSKVHNPSSTHKEGIEASFWLENARKNIAKVLGCYEDEIFFVSSSSEAIAWVAKMRKIIAHPTSHHSVIEAQKDCNPKLINELVLAIPYYDSETGQRNKIEDIDNEIFLDLTASIGKEKINLHNMKKVTYACLSSHKFGGILGAGLLYIRKDVQQYIQPLIWGSQEQGYRGGTENYPAIIVMSEALKKCYEHFDENKAKINELMDYLTTNMPKCKFQSANSTLNITFNKLSAQTAVVIFDKEGVAISAGSACNSHSVEPSSTLLYRGYTKDEALKTIRVSLSENNTIEECKNFIKILKDIIDKYD